MKNFSCRTLWLLAGLLAINVTLAAPAPDAVEFKKIEGTWVGGVKAPGGKGKSGQGMIANFSELVIKDGKVVSCKDGKGVSLGNCESLTLNPAAKTLDATGNTKRDRGTFQGIYRVNGDALEWCAANPGIARPKDYFTTPQVQFHMVLQRKKN